MSVPLENVISVRGGIVGLLAGEVDRSSGRKTYIPDAKSCLERAATSCRKRDGVEFTPGGAKPGAGMAA